MKETIEEYVENASPKKIKEKLITYENMMRDMMARIEEVSAENKRLKHNNKKILEELNSDIPVFKEDILKILLDI